MKIVFLLAAIFFFNGSLFSQWAGNEDPLTIKELRLTRFQQKEIRKINKDAETELSLLKKDNGSTEEIRTKIDKIKGGRIKKIRNILNPGQQITWRKKMMENRPHRGATGLPNERAVQ